MSYDIYLRDPVSKEVIELQEPHHIQGGTYQLGGSKELWLNITYNYSKFYHLHNEEDIRIIYGKTGQESIKILEEMAKKIYDVYGPDPETSKDYWEPLPGNAVRPLLQLIIFATMRPDGVWDGD